MKFTTAPMGWNSWDCYGAAVDEKTVRANAEYMAKNLKSFGWEYVVVDIQWSEPEASTNEYHPFADLCMDEYGRLLPAPNRFPSAEGGKGFKPLADYVHSLGLKFGIHIMRGIPRQAVSKNCPVLGTNTTARQVAKTASICFWNTDMYGLDPDREGAREYYDSIFALYASWGVDFIKCDDICRELPHEEKEMVMLSESLRSCGRDMVLSLSPGPALLEKAELYKQVANMWRITDDFWDDWKLLYNMFERAEKWSIHTGQGNYPDADMLPVGPIRQCYDPDAVTKFTKEEQITMMTLWAIMRSPLMIGGEMTKFDDFTYKLLTNEGILDMHKNARHSHQVYRREINGVETVLWIASSANGGEYVAVFNIGDTNNTVEVSLDDLEWTEAKEACEMWTAEKLTWCDGAKISLPAHSAKAYYFK
ncbi:MAG: glycoside hydrolase family 27 protein [Lachnospiraceae bacterium]|nr:glycoside hydrolase family 27 protein [Lachnospiraceae bacterium]